MKWKKMNLCSFSWNSFLFVPISSFTMYFVWKLFVYGIYYDTALSTFIITLFSFDMFECHLSDWQHFHDNVKGCWLDNYFFLGSTLETFKQLKTKVGKLLDSSDCRQYYVLPVDKLRICTKQRHHTMMHVCASKKNKCIMCIKGIFNSKTYLRECIMF